MRTLSVISCTVVICGLTMPALADRLCGGGRCSTVSRVTPPVGHWRHHVRHRAGCCCRAPAGWGWYRRQKFYHDCSAPLAVVDELGEVTFVRER